MGKLVTGPKLSLGLVGKFETTNCKIKCRYNPIVTPQTATQVFTYKKYSFIQLLGLILNILFTNLGTNNYSDGSA